MMLIDDDRWTSTIVALPIFLYTSYVLYDRSRFFFSLSCLFCALIWYTGVYRGLGMELLMRYIYSVWE